MNAFATLADPVRRRIVEVLANGEQTAGALGAVVQAEFGISQPAVSNQLRTLREAAVVEVEAQGARRVYRLAPGALDDVAAWVARYAALWPQRLDALETELARGRRAARASVASASAASASAASASATSATSPASAPAAEEASA